MYDEYAAAYCNLMEKEEFENASDKQLLRIAAQYADDETNHMIEHAKDFGMLINDTWYNDSDIREMLGE
jgi:hypothetical protein